MSGQEAGSRLRACVRYTVGHPRGLFLLPPLDAAAVAYVLARRRFDVFVKLPIDGIDLVDMDDDMRAIAEEVARDGFDQP